MLIWPVIIMPLICFIWPTAYMSHIPLSLFVTCCGASRSRCDALKIRKFEILGEQSTSESVLSTSLSLDNKLSPRFPEEMQLGRSYHQRCHPPLVLMLKENMVLMLLRKTCGRSRFSSIGLDDIVINFNAENWLQGVASVPCCAIGVRFERRTDDQKISSTNRWSEDPSAAAWDWRQKRMTRFLKQLWFSDKLGMGQIVT